MNFHTFDVGRGAAHLAAFADAVAVDVAGVGGEAANLDAFAAHVIRGVDARVAFQNGAEVVGAVVLVFLDVQHVHGLRRFLLRDRKSVV